MVQIKPSQQSNWLNSLSIEEGEDKAGLRIRRRQVLCSDPPTKGSGFELFFEASGNVSAKWEGWGMIMALFEASTQPSGTGWRA
jgi:hypothetical protein